MEKVLTKECKWRETHHRLFRDLLNGTLSRVDGEKLERAVLAIAMLCIAKLSVSRHWRLDKLGISPYDLAVDAVTKLLLRDGTQHYARLRKALERMNSVVEDSPSICHYVHGILNKLVLQACSEMLAEHDSVHTKMKRALRHHEEHTPELTLLDTIEGPAYHLASTDILSGRPYMPLNELSATSPQNAQVRGEGAPTNPAVRMLYAILDHLSEQDEYRRTVHEKDVLSIMKKWVACVYEAEGGESYEYEPSDITGCKIHAHIAAALEKIREWVEGSYVRKAKLTSTMAESILDAIKEYAHDAAHGEPEQPSIYLRKEGMSSEEYRKKYREIYRHILTRFDEEMPPRWRKGNA